MTVKYKRSGDQLHFTAGGTLVSGAVHIENDTLGILANNYVSGDAAVLGIAGTYGSVAIKSADVVTPGLDLYWDSGNSEFTITATANRYAGKAASSAANGVVLGDITLVSNEAT